MPDDDEAEDGHKKQDAEDDDFESEAKAEGLKVTVDDGAERDEPRTRQRSQVMQKRYWRRYIYLWPLAMPVSGC